MAQRCSMLLASSACLYGDRSTCKAPFLYHEGCKYSSKATPQTIGWTGKLPNIAGLLKIRTKS